MDNLKPPTYSVDKSNTLSTQEFQKMLNVWFEEKGIISDLRSELRLKMIHVLKNTAIGRNIGNRTYRKSLFNRAVDLIVAEYLVQNKCYYSLSIFNVEASLKNMFSEYSINFQTLTPYDEFYFDDKEVLNILETVGFAKHSECGEELLNLYFQEQENRSLLVCIINLLKKRLSDDSTNKYIFNSANIEMQNDDFIKQIGAILTEANLPTNKLKNIMANIAVIYNIEKKILEDQHSNILKLQDKCAYKEKRVKELIDANKILEDAVLKMDKNCSKLTLYVKDLKDKLKLSKANVAKDKKNEELPGKVCNNGKEIVTSNTVHDYQGNNLCKLKHCDNYCVEVRSRNEILEKENIELKQEVERQKQENRMLNSRCKELISEFTYCQNKMDLLKLKIEGNPKSVNFQDEANVSLLEARFVKINESSEMSSDSITEDIVQQARFRLQKLEEETKEIEEKYRNIYSNK